MWTYHRTPDLSAIVQEIIDRDGWLPGNALSFLFLGENQGPSEVENAREWESFENIADPEDGGDGQNHPDRVPELVIYYSISSGLFTQAIIATDTITDEGVTFAASSDDAEQENDEIDSLFDDDIDTGWEGEPDDQNILTAGLRFQSIGVPKGAVIDSAFIEVFSHESKTTEDVARITLVGDATDDAETFTEDALISDRPRTNAQLLWEVDEEWGLWTPHRTIDIKEIIQEIVDRDGWEAGNSLAILMLGENQGPSEVENAREFESFENIADPEDGGDGQNHPERVPVLYVYFSSPNEVTSIFNVDASNVKELSLYPNPTDQLVTVELENADAANIQIFNMNGQRVGAIQNKAGKLVEISTANLIPGVYIVQAEQDNNIYVQRLIIKR